MHQMCEVSLLFILLQKVTLEPESIVLVLKTSCCSPVRIYSSLALQRPVSFIFLLPQLIWQCLALEDKEYFEHRILTCVF